MPRLLQSVKLMSGFANAKVLKMTSFMVSFSSALRNVKKLKKLSMEKSSVLAWVFRCGVMNGFQRVTHFTFN